MKVLKVLMVLNELLPSGAESMLRVAAPEWARHGVTCEILSTGASIGSYAGALAAAGYALHHIPFSRRPDFVWQLLRLFRGYDVVHVHTERANFTYGLCARLLGARTVRTVHSSFSYTGFRRAARVVQRRVLSLFGVTHVAIGTSVALVERTVLFNPTTTVSDWFDSAAYRPPTPLERAEARRTWGLHPDDVALALVGNCSPIKNHEALIRAVAALPTAQRERLVVLHVGSAAAESAERRLAEQLGLAGRLRFLGQLPDVRSVLHAADAFAMPSRWEGLGIAALEALGCGLPALLTDVPGLRDLRQFDAGVTWAAKPTADALAAALVTLLDGLAGLSSRARAGQGELAQRFGPTRGIQAYVAIFRRTREAACSPSSW